MKTTLPNQDYSGLYSLNQLYLPMDASVLIPKDDSVRHHGVASYYPVWLYAGNLFDPRHSTGVQTKHQFHVAAEREPSAVPRDDTHLKVLQSAGAINGQARTGFSEEGARGEKCLIPLETIAALG
jgi:hypothetical protein